MSAWGRPRLGGEQTPLGLRCDLVRAPYASSAGIDTMTSPGPAPHAYCCGRDEPYARLLYQHNEPGCPQPKST